MNVVKYALDLSKEPKALPILYLGQGDKDGTQLVCTFFDNGAAYDLAGSTAKFEMALPGRDGYYSVDGQISGNIATFTIDETYAAAVPGKSPAAYVTLVKNGAVCSTTRITAIVLPSATEGIDPASAYDNRIAEFMDEQEARLDAAIEAVEDISELHVPLMSATTVGGAKLGQGLELVDGALGVAAADFVMTDSDAQLNSVELAQGADTHGDIHRIVDGADATQADNNVASVQRPSNFDVRDANERTVARLEGVVSPSGPVGYRLYAQNFTQAASPIRSYFECMVAKDGTVTCDATHPDEIRAALNAAGLDVTENVFTGYQNVASSNIDRDGANPEELQRGVGWYLTDQDNEVIGRIRPIWRTDGTMSLLLQVARENDGGTEVVNTLQLHVAKDGTATYGVTDGKAFRTAIGANSSGVWPLSQGGSGQDSVTEMRDASIVTLASGYTLNSANWRKWGPVAQLAVSVKNTSAIAEGANITPFTIASAYRPQVRAAGGDRFFAASIAANDGVCYARALAAVAANSNLFFSFTYITTP